MGGDTNTERFAKMAAAGDFNGKGYSTGVVAKADGTPEPKVGADTGTAETGISSNAEYFRDKKGYSVDGYAVYRDTHVQRDVSFPNFQLPDKAGNLQGSSSISYPATLSNRISETQQNIIRNADRARVTGINTGTQNLQQKPSVSASRDNKRVSDIIKRTPEVIDQSGPKPYSASQMRQAMKDYPTADEGTRAGMQASMPQNQFDMVRDHVPRTPEEILKPVQTPSVKGNRRKKGKK